MKIKKFEAFEMSEALRAIREELGPDAVLLSTREVRKQGAAFSLLGRTVIEVTAAVDLPEPEEAGSAGPSGDFGRVLKAAQTDRPADDRAGILNELQEIKKAIASMNSGPRRMEPATVGRIQKACLEMRGMLKVLVESADRRTLDEALSGMNPTLTRLFEKLTENGMGVPSALQLLKVLQKRLTADDLWREDFVRDYARQTIAKMVRVAGPLESEAAEDKVVVLVGPTGVGKTTTIAKLAARQIGQKKKATLMTLDAHRVGALEQFRTYAKMIGATVETVVSVAKLREVLSNRKRDGLVLVDTPGQSHLNIAQMAELQDLGRMEIPVEIHLVLSLGTKEADLNEMVDRFSAVRFNRLLFTKLDETRTFGALFSTLRIKDTPLSYITTGQRVPEDIEAATPKRVAELVMN
ncbi:MAG TPA: flagellar biosynthesis protein FlhF [Nitrospiria bacterium]|nr:flagellar biosynthesis protein FlhF [Nitrospiria bacterium]